MAEKNFVYMTGLVAGGLQVWLLWDQKLASEPISVNSEMIPSLHKAELFSNTAGSCMISYLWQDKKYTAVVSDKSKKMWEKELCRHQSERRRRGEGAPGTGSVSPAVHGKPCQSKCPHCSLYRTRLWLTGKPGNSTHHIYSNQKENSLSGIIIQRGCQCFLAHVGTIIKRSITVCSET